MRRLAITMAVLTAAGFNASANPEFRPFCSPVNGGKCLSRLVNLSNERSIFN